MARNACHFLYTNRIKYELATTKMKGCAIMPSQGLYENQAETF